MKKKKLSLTGCLSSNTHEHYTFYQKKKVTIFICRIFVLNLYNLFESSSSQIKDKLLIIHIYVPEDC